MYALFEFVILFLLFVIVCAFAISILTGLCCFCIEWLLSFEEVIEDIQERLSKRNRIGCVVVMDVPDATETDRQEASFCKVVADAVVIN